MADLVVVPVYNEAPSIEKVLTQTLGAAPDADILVVDDGSTDESPAILARYMYNLAGVWRKVYVICASPALYFNLFVLVVQAFLKVPALHAMAPTQAEPPFVVAQVAVLILIALLATLAVIKFRVPVARPA